MTDLNLDVNAHLNLDGTDKAKRDVDSLNASVDALKANLSSVQGPSVGNPSAMPYAMQTVGQRQIYAPSGPEAVSGRLDAIAAQDGANAARVGSHLTRQRGLATRVGFQPGQQPGGGRSSPFPVENADPATAAAVAATRGNGGGGKPPRSPRTATGAGADDDRVPLSGVEYQSALAAKRTQDRRDREDAMRLHPESFVPELQQRAVRQTRLASQSARVLARQQAADDRDRSFHLPSGPGVRFSPYQTDPEYHAAVAAHQATVRDAQQQGQRLNPRLGVTRQTDLAATRTQNRQDRQTSMAENPQLYTPELEQQQVRADRQAAADERERAGRFRAPSGPAMRFSPYETDPDYHIAQAEHQTAVRAAQVQAQKLRPDLSIGGGGNDGGGGRLTSLHRGARFALGAVGLPLTIGAAGSMLFGEMGSEASLSRTARTSFGGDAGDFTSAVYGATAGLGVLNSEAANLAREHAKLAGQFKDQTDVATRVASTAVTARAFGISPEEAMGLQSPFIASGLLGTPTTAGAMDAVQLTTIFSQAFANSGFGARTGELIDVMGKLGESVSTRNATPETAGQVRTVAGLVTGIAKASGGMPNEQAIATIANTLDQSIAQPQTPLGALVSFNAAAYAYGQEHRDAQGNPIAGSLLDIQKQQELGASDVYNLAGFIGAGTPDELTKRLSSVSGLGLHQAEQALSGLPMQDIGNGEKKLDVAKFMAMYPQAMQGNQVNLQAATYMAMYQPGESEKQTRQTIQQFLGQSPSAVGPQQQAAIDGLTDMANGKRKADPSEAQRLVGIYFQNGGKGPASPAETAANATVDIRNDVSKFLSPIIPVMGLLGDVIDPVVGGLHALNGGLGKAPIIGGGLQAGAAITEIAGGIYAAKGVAGIVGAGAAKLGGGIRGLFGAGKAAAVDANGLADGSMEAILPPWLFDPKHQQAQSNAASHHDLGRVLKGIFLPSGGKADPNGGALWQRLFGKPKAKAIDPISDKIPASQSTIADFLPGGVSVSGGAPLSGVGPPIQIGAGSQTVQGVIRFNEIDIQQLTISSLTLPQGSGAVLGAPIAAGGGPALTPSPAGAPVTTDPFAALRPGSAGNPLIPAFAGAQQIEGAAAAAAAGARPATAGGGTAPRSIAPSHSTSMGQFFSTSLVSDDTKEIAKGLGLNPADTKLLTQMEVGIGLNESSLNAGAGSWDTAMGMFQFKKGGAQYNWGIAHGYSQKQMEDPTTQLKILAAGGWMTQGLAAYKQGLGTSPGMANAMAEQAQEGGITPAEVPGYAAGTGATNAKLAQQLIGQLGASVNPTSTSLPAGQGGLVQTNGDVRHNFAIEPITINLRDPQGTVQQFTVQPKPKPMRSESGFLS